MQICCPLFLPLSFYWPSSSRKSFLTIYLTETRVCKNTLHFFPLQIQYCCQFRACTRIFTLHQWHGGSSPRAFCLQSICQLSRLLSYGHYLRSIRTSTSWNQIQMEWRAVSWQVVTKNFCSAFLKITFQKVKKLGGFWGNFTVVENKAQSLIFFCIFSPFGT